MFIGWPFCFLSSRLRCVPGLAWSPSTPAPTSSSKPLKLYSQKQRHRRQPCPNPSPKSLRCSPSPSSLFASSATRPHCATLARGRWRKSLWPTDARLVNGTNLHTSYKRPRRNCVVFWPFPAPCLLTHTFGVPFPFPVPRDLLHAGPCQCRSCRIS